MRFAVASAVAVVVSNAVAASGGVVVSWDFNEGAGSTLHDVSGRGHDGAIHGATWAQGLHGGALRFDGDDWVVVPHAPDLALGCGTVEIVFRPAGGFSGPPGGGNEELFAKEVSGVEEGNVEILMQEGGTLTVEAEPASFPLRYVRSDRTSWGDHWYHVAYVFGPSGMRLFVDGILQSDEDLVPISWVLNTRDIVLGYNLASSDPGDGFVGRIDAIRISDSALTPDEFLGGGPTAVEGSSWSSLKAGFR